MNVVDLFSGIGGLSLGFKNTGYNIVLANEVDREIAESYKKNNPKTKMINKDITSIDIEGVFTSVSNVDVVLGGPPCQGFSQKGKRLSLEDPRNFLFRYFFRVIQTIQPRYFVMENVPTFLTVEEGFFKDEVFRLFESIGYTLSADVLNAGDFGVPQNRRRAVIIGRRGDRKVALTRLKHRPSNMVWDAISDLAFLQSGEGEFEQEYRVKPKTLYETRLRGLTDILHNHEATRHSPQVINRLQLLPINGSRKDLPTSELTKSIYSGTWSRMRKNEKSVTITTRFDTPSSGRFTHPFLDRAITVREAARLQSFPDSFVFYGTKSSQMKQVGNAVPPLMSKALAELILNDERGI